MINPHNTHFENAKISSQQAEQLQKACQYIASCQYPTGAIYWFREDKLDPWDHTEAAIGLIIGGRIDEARAAIEWLKKNQNSDGSWFSEYKRLNKQDVPSSTKIETNFVAYPATGLWYFYSATRDRTLLEEYFNTVARAIDYVIALQTDEGDIQWAIDSKTPLPQDALITACSSILKSIECALLCANILSIQKPNWLMAYQKLKTALLNKPHRFDRTWDPKTRFSMDWFYPILAGIFTPEETNKRLKEKWNVFFKNNMGCRCVSDQPWITVAESCELTLALIAGKQYEQAFYLHCALYKWQDVTANEPFLTSKLPANSLLRDGGFFTGYNFTNKMVWPVEKTSWTNAAMLLAADALFKLTPAHTIFKQSYIATPTLLAH